MRDAQSRSRRGPSVVVLLVLALTAAVAPSAAAAPTLMRDDFSSANGPGGLITNQYAFWSSNPAAVQSPNWEMTSGSLFSQDGMGWTGVPDAVVPDIGSTNGTGSRVFRLRTRRSDFSSVRQTVSVRINGYVALDAGGTSYDGVVLWPRYQSEFALYFAYLLRRDGKVQMTKKCAGELPGGGYYNGGTYFPLTPVQFSAATEAGRWYRLATDVRDQPDGSVTIRAFRDGVLIAEATDDGVGCPPLAGPARLGVRGDNTDFNLDSYRVRALF